MSGFGKSHFPKTKRRGKVSGGKITEEQVVRTDKEPALGEAKTNQSGPLSERGDMTLSDVRK